MTIDPVSFDQFLALLGIVIGIYGILDARRQRSAREKAVIAAHSVIERTYGLLIGIKPFVAPLGSMHLDAVNDGLEAINQQRASLKTL